MSNDNSAKSDYVIVNVAPCNLNNLKLLVKDLTNQYGLDNYKLIALTDIPSKDFQEELLMAGAKRVMYKPLEIKDLL